MAQYTLRAEMQVRSVQCKTQMRKYMCPSCLLTFQQRWQHQALRYASLLPLTGTLQLQPPTPTCKMPFCCCSAALCSGVMSASALAMPELRRPSSSGTEVSMPAARHLFKAELYTLELLEPALPE